MSGGVPNRAEPVIQTVTGLRAMAGHDGLALIAGGRWSDLDDAMATSILRRMEAEPSGHLVYGVTQPGVDYHWYRLESDGTWSGKHGMGNVAGGMADPRLTGDRASSGLHYAEDAGFFWCGPGAVTLGPTGPLENVVKTFPAGAVVSDMGGNPTVRYFGGGNVLVLPGSRLAEDTIARPDDRLGIVRLYYRSDWGMLP